MRLQDPLPVQKPVRWIGRSRKELMALPLQVRDRIGLALWFAQAGARHGSAKTLKEEVLRLIGQRLKTAAKIAQELQNAKAQDQDR